VNPIPTEVVVMARAGINGARVPQRSGAGELFAVPGLEELAADPGKARVLDGHTTDVLETTAIAALNALRSRKLALAAQAVNSSDGHKGDRLLKARDVAQRLAVEVDWVYHRTKRLPFTVYLEGVPRFSENGLEEFIRKRRNS
jgi:hypothetical protein